MCVCVCNGKCYWLVLTVYSYGFELQLVMFSSFFSLFRYRNLSKYVVCEICISFPLRGSGLSYNKTGSNTFK